MIDRFTARSRAYHQAVAARLMADPEPALIKARAWLAQLSVESPQTRSYAREWSRWLERPISDVYHLLAEDPSEYAEALRRMSPFVGLINSHERWEIYRAFRSDGWRHHAP